MSTEFRNQGAVSPCTIYGVANHVIFGIKVKMISGLVPDRRSHQLRGLRRLYQRSRDQDLREVVAER